MTGCDRCQCFADSLTSLDGFTLLCSECLVEIQSEKEHLINNPPSLCAARQSVWTHLIQEQEPFRIQDQRVVFYGSENPSHIESLLAHWSKLSQEQIPADILDFGLPTEDCDIDGQPMHTSFGVYRLKDSMISIEEYGCWIKIQLWFHYAT